jgi:hypothetical protein
LPENFKQNLTRQSAKLTRPLGASRTFTEGRHLHARSTFEQVNDERATRVQPPALVASACHRWSYRGVVESRANGSPSREIAVRVPEAQTNQAAMDAERAAKARLEEQRRSFDAQLAQEKAKNGARQGD